MGPLKVFLEFIEDIPHRCTLFNSDGDGIECVDSSGSYDIYLDGKLIIDILPFSGKEISYLFDPYYFDASALCPLTTFSTFIFHVQHVHINNNTSFQISETSRSTEITLKPFDTEEMNYSFLFRLFISWSTRFVHHEYCNE